MKESQQNQWYDASGCQFILALYEVPLLMRRRPTNACLSDLHRIISGFDFTRLDSHVFPQLELVKTSSLRRSRKLSRYRFHTLKFHRINTSITECSSCKAFT